MACGLYGITKDGKYYKIDELYGSRINEDKVISWILDRQKEYGRYFRFINCDNARPEQNHKLRQALNGIIVHEKKPKVIDSIGIVRSIINYDRLIVNKDRCKNTLREFGLYRYPNEQERTDRFIDLDTPLKKMMTQWMRPLCFVFLRNQLWLQVFALAGVIYFVNTKLYPNG